MIIDEETLNKICDVHKELLVIREKLANLDLPRPYTDDFNTLDGVEIYLQNASRRLTGFIMRHT